MASINKKRQQATNAILPYRHVLPISVFLVLFAAAVGHAQTLPQVWQAALTQSTDAQLIDAQLAQTQAKSDVADSLYKPKVMLSGSLGYGSSHMQMAGATFTAPSFAQMGIASVDNAAFEAKANRAVINQISLMAQQPLYSPKLNAQAAQLRLDTAMAETKASLDKNQLMLNVAKLYYNLAVAQKSVAVFQKQRIAAQKMLDEARFRFKIGDAPVTGIHEATANLAMIDAHIAAAQSEVKNTQAQLTAKTGITDITANLPTNGTVNLNQMTTANVTLLDSVMSNNLGLKLASLNEQLARQTAAEQKPFANLAVNAVGMFTRSNSDGKGYGGDGEITQQNAMIGIQASLPLYTGGAQTANYRALQQGVTAAQRELDKNKLEVRTQTLSYVNSRQALQSQLDALNAAYTAGKLRLDATLIGKKVGDKTLLDVLNAQNDLVRIELEITQAQVNLTLIALNLAMLNNQLTALISE